MSHLFLHFVYLLESHANGGQADVYPPEISGG
jgi:hypothetical protein